MFSLYLYLWEYEWMGFIRLLVYWSKYFLLRILLFYQLSMVSEKLVRLFQLVQCLSEQLPHTQYLVLAAPVPYLSRQLPQPGNSFSGSNNLKCFHYIPNSLLYYRSLCYVSCSLPELYVKNSICCFKIILFISCFYSMSVKSCL